MTRAIVVACAVALVAGCGGSGPQSIVADTPEKTADAGPARSSMTGSIEGNERGPNTITAGGALDGDRGRVTLTSEQNGRESKTVIAHDGTVYYIDPAGGDVPEGKTWLKIDVAKFSPGTSDLGGFIQFLQADPLRPLAFVAAGSEDVEEVGTEDVRGVETTHYRTTVNVEQGAKASDDLGDAYGGLAESSGFDEFPAELWIDDDGVCRRLAYELPISQQGGGGTAKVAIELYDFGADVDVAPPSEDDAFDLGGTLEPTSTGQAPR